MTLMQSLLVLVVTAADGAGTVATLPKFLNPLGRRLQDIPEELPAECLEACSGAAAYLAAMHAGMAAADGEMDAMVQMGMTCDHLDAHLCVIYGDGAALCGMADPSAEIPADAGNDLRCMCTACNQEFMATMQVFGHDEEHSASSDAHRRLTDAACSVTVSDVTVVLTVNEEDSTAAAAPAPAPAPASDHRRMTGHIGADQCVGIRLMQCWAQNDVCASTASAEAGGGVVDEVSAAACATTTTTTTAVPVVMAFSFSMAVENAETFIANEQNNVAVVAGIVAAACDTTTAAEPAAASGGHRRLADTRLLSGGGDSSSSTAAVAAPSVNVAASIRVVDEDAAELLRSKVSGVGQGGMEVFLNAALAEADLSVVTVSSMSVTDANGEISELSFDISAASGTAAGVLILLAAHSLF